MEEMDCARDKVTHEEDKVLCMHVTKITKEICMMIMLEEQMIMHT